MRLEVLVSCMYETDLSIVRRSNIQTDVLVISQCDQNFVKNEVFTNKFGKQCSARLICTTERGLSRSRNMAIRNSKGDICLICDDDETLEDDYEYKILDSFKKNAIYDIIAFRLKNNGKIYPDTEERITIYKTGKIGSCQIAFRRNQKILANCFCEIMGSGTGNGGGEENKFLVDCIKKGCRILYIPLMIATISPHVQSNWFNGYNEKYWCDRGWNNKMIYGVGYAIPYIFVTTLFKARHHDKENSLLQILRWMFRGVFQKRL